MVSFPRSLLPYWGPLRIRWMLKATITAENLTSQTCIEKCGSCTAAMSQKLLRVRIYTQSSLGTFVSVVLCFNSIVFLILFGNDSTPFNEKTSSKFDMGSKVSKTSAKQILKSSQFQWYRCLAAHLMPISNGLRSQSSLFGSKFSSWRKLVVGMSKWW